VQSQVPPTAIGKDYPMEVTGSVDAFPNRLLGFARWFSVSQSVGKGSRSTFFGAVLGFDIRRAALKLPEIGSPGMTFGT